MEQIFIIALSTSEKEYVPIYYVKDIADACAICTLLNEDDENVYSIIPKNLTSLASYTKSNISEENMHIGLVERVIKYFIRKNDYSYDARNEIFQALLYLIPKQINELIDKHKLKDLYNINHFSMLC